MAALIVQYDPTKDPLRALANALARIRDAVADFGDARNAMIGYCDGATNVAANWAALVSADAVQAGGYATAGDAAMAVFAQADSLYQKLTAASGVGDATGAATSQLCQVLGVV